MKDLDIIPAVDLDEGAVGLLMRMHDALSDCHEEIAVFATGKMDLTAGEVIATEIPGRVMLLLSTMASLTKENERCLGCLGVYVDIDGASRAGKDIHSKVDGIIDAMRKNM